ncbi:MAG: ABC transporter substrate-binding protein [Nitrospinota bacterium]
MKRRLVISRRSFLKATGGLAGVLAAGSAPPFIREAGASKRRKVTFALPWLLIGGHSFVFAAQQKYWKDRGLDVSVSRGFGSGDTCKKVAAGQFQFGEASYGPLVATAAAGGDIVGIGVKLQRTPMCVVCRSDKNIKTPKDIEGKRFALAPGSGSAQLLPAFFRAAGVNGDKVEKSAVGPAAKVPMLMGDKADCVEIYYVSIAPLTRKMNPVIFLFADVGLKMLDLGLLTTSKMVRNEPQVCRDIAEGAMEALKLQILDPEAAINLMLQARPELKASPRVNLVIDQGRTNYLSLDPIIVEKGLGYMREVNQRETRENVLKYMGIKSAPPVEKLFTNRFVGSVKLTQGEYDRASSMAQRFAPGAA